MNIYKQKSTPSMTLMNNKESFEERKHILDSRVVDYDTNVSFNVDDVVGWDKI